MEAGARAVAESKAQYVARRKREYEDLRRQAEAKEAAEQYRLPAADEVGRRLAGEGGALAGLFAGIPVGAFHLGQTTFSAASFGGRLADPDDAAVSPPGQAAWDDVFRGAKHVLDHARSLASDHGRLYRDINHVGVGSNVHIRAAPGALASSAGGEFERDYQTGLALAAGPKATGYLPSGAPQRLIDAMAEDYQGIGSHAPIRRATKLPWGGQLPRRILDSPFNRTLPLAGTPKGAFYRYHYAIDPSYWGGNVKRVFGGGGWSGRALGWKKYGPLARGWYGTAGKTKLAGYGALAGVGAGLHRPPAGRPPR